MPSPPSSKTNFLYHRGSFYTGEERLVTTRTKARAHGFRRDPCEVEE